MFWAEIVGRLQKGIWNLLYLLRLWGKFASAKYLACENFLFLSESFLSSDMLCWILCVPEIDFIDIFWAGQPLPVWSSCWLGITSQAVSICFNHLGCWSKIMLSWLLSGTVFVVYLRIQTSCFLFCQMAWFSWQDLHGLVPPKVWGEEFLGLTRNKLY